MGKYVCSKCKEENKCNSNTSGYGICPKCIHHYHKDIDEIPKHGKIEDIPDKYKYLFGRWFT